MNESFLNNGITDNELHIDGYTLHRHDRIENPGELMGGGLLAYTRNDHNFHEVANSHLCTPHIECFWLKLHLKKAKCTNVCIFYQLPDGNVDEFLTALSDQMAQLESSIHG